MDFDLLEKAIKEILCCPLCKGILVLAENKENLKCDSCNRGYSIHNGIVLFLLEDVQEEQGDELRFREKISKKYEKADLNEILKDVSRYHSIPIMAGRASIFRSNFNASQWILDAGCGTGWYWRGSEGGNLILLDFTLGNLKAAWTVLGKDNKCLLIQADVANMPIKDGSLSGVWSVQMTQHLTESVLSLFLKEVKRSLKDKFLLEIYNLNPGILHVLLHKILGKSLHLKGKMGNRTLNRLNGAELLSLWKDVAEKANRKVGHSELFFHPEYHVKPKGRTIEIMEKFFSNFPGICGSFARQIQIRIIFDL